MVDSRGASEVDGKKMRLGPGFGVLIQSTFPSYLICACLL